MRELQNLRRRVTDLWLPKMCLWSPVWIPFQDSIVIVGLEYKYNAVRFTCLGVFIDFGVGSRWSFLKYPDSETHTPTHTYTLVKYNQFRTGISSNVYYKHKCTILI